MRFVVTLPQLWDPRRPDRYQPTFELARVAEAEGFETAAVGHHHLMADRMSDPFVMLAAVAASTSTIRLATSVFQLAVHQPLPVAESVACLDLVSGGRISLGVGLGWSSSEYEAYGAKFAERGARLEESLGVLRRLWTEEGVQHEGRFFAVRGVTLQPRPLQRPHPPLWVAGADPRAVARAARLGDAWLCGPVQSVAAVKASLSVYRDECVGAGRMPAWVLRRYAWIENDERRLREEFLPRFVASELDYWRRSVETEDERHLFARIDRGERVSDTEVARGRALLGTPEEVGLGIEQLVKETGVEHLHLDFGGRARSLAVDTASGAVLMTEVRTMLERFGREILPFIAS